MNLRKLGTVVIILASIAGIFVIFGKSLDVHYPPGITIVQVISKFREGLTKKYVNSAGGGFFIDNKYIATNGHVVERVGSFGRQRAEINIFDGKHKHPARIVGFDKDADIALVEPLSWCDIKIQNPCFDTVADKDIKQEVFTYPYPPSMSLSSSFFDLLLNPYPGSESLGNRFSARFLKGHILGFEDWLAIQSIAHSSGIVPGYSGTPLLNSNNCYIGMNFRYDPSKRPISYAISNINLQPVFKELKEYGYVETGFLGMVVVYTNGQLYVSAVVKNGPAEFLKKLGIQTLEMNGEDKLEKLGGLYIYLVNGTEIKDVKQLWDLVKDIKPDNSVRIVLKDQDGKSYNEDIKIVSRFHYFQKYSLVDFRFGPFLKLLIIV